MTNAIDLVAIRFSLARASCARSFSGDKTHLCR